jgi:hypothetical protein
LKPLFTKKNNEQRFIQRCITEQKQSVNVIINNNNNNNDDDDNVRFRCNSGGRHSAPDDSISINISIVINNIGNIGQDIGFVGRPATTTRWRRPVAIRRRARRRRRRLCRRRRCRLRRKFIGYAGASLRWRVLFFAWCRPKRNLSLMFFFFFFFFFSVKKEVEQWHAGTAATPVDACVADVEIERNAIRSRVN